MPQPSELSTALHQRIQRMEMRLMELARDLEEIRILIASEYGNAAPQMPVRRTLNIKSLSPRETEVLRALVSGSRVSTIARTLTISPHTVRNHLKSIYRKLNVRSQTELVELFGPQGPLQHPSVPLPFEVGGRMNAHTPDVSPWFCLLDGNGVIQFANGPMTDGLGGAALGGQSLFAMLEGGFVEEFRGAIAKAMREKSETPVTLSLGGNRVDGALQPIQSSDGDIRQFAFQGQPSAAVPQFSRNYMD